MSPRARQFFDPQFITEGEANELWHRCMQQIETAHKKGYAPGIFKVRGVLVQVSLVLNANGHLVRFWLRQMVSNALVLVGNRQGLLPLDVEPIHG